MSYLRKFLPKELDVFTGFILRPATKTGKSSKIRKDEFDQHSSQLDIIVYDSARYPLFQKFENNVIVPPEGVIAIFSVKKTLGDSDIANECQALLDACKLCSCENAAGQKMRKPYLALVGMSSSIKKSNTDTHDWIFKKIKEVYHNPSLIGFSDLVGYVGALDSWSIFKKRPLSKKATKAEYVLLKHNDEEQHLCFQFLLTGILSVYYDPTRTAVARPGFTSFESGRNHDRLLGEITVTKEK